MNVFAGDKKLSTALNNGWLEIEGQPRPGIEEAVDDAIYKVMIEQRREINRRNLPEIDP